MRTCIDCHLLAKSQVQNDGITTFTWTWDETDRANKYVRLDQNVPECHKQMWSMRLEPMLPYVRELDKNRRRCAFFVPYQRGMSFAAAIDLLDLKAAHRISKITIIGILVAAVIGVIGWFL